VREGIFFVDISRAILPRRCLIRRNIMVKVILTVDPSTGRGLYKNEETVLGVFASIQEAIFNLGEFYTSRFCNIQTV